MRKFWITAIAATALALPFTLTATQAQATGGHSHRVSLVKPAVSANGHVCDDGSSPLCLNDVADGSQGGTPINLNSGTPNYTGERWEVDEAFACPVSGGVTDVVTADCPFNNLTWDNTYLGKPLVAIASTTVMGCAGSKPSNPGLVALESCTQAESVYVVAPSSHGGDALINPYQSNNLSNGHVQALTGSNTAGTQATLANWNDGALQGWTW